MCECVKQKKIQIFDIFELYLNSFLLHALPSPLIQSVSSFCDSIQMKQFFFSCHGLIGLKLNWEHKLRTNNNNKNTVKGEQKQQTRAAFQVFLWFRASSSLSVIKHFIIPTTNICTTRAWNKLNQFQRERERDRIKRIFIPKYSQERRNKIMLFLPKESYQN